MYRIFNILTNVHKVKQPTQYELVLAAIAQIGGAKGFLHGDQTNTLHVYCDLANQWLDLYQFKPGDEEHYFLLLEWTLDRMRKVDPHWRYNADGFGQKKSPNYPKVPAPSNVVK